MAWLPAMPDKPKRKTAGKAVKAVRAAKEAQGVLEGKTVAQIAREQGVTTRTVSRDLVSPAARDLFESLYDEHEGALRKLFARSVEVIAEGLEAELTIVPESGEPISVPDTRGRLAAVDQLRKLLELRQRLAPSSSANHLPQFKEIEAWVRVRQVV